MGSFREMQPKDDKEDQAKSKAAAELWESASPEEREDLYRKIAGDMLQERAKAAEGHEPPQAEIIHRALAALFLTGLDTLKHCLEDPEQPEISWNAPLVEFAIWGDIEEAPLPQDADLSSFKSAAESLTEAALWWDGWLLLTYMTQGAAFLQREEGEHEAVLQASYWEGIEAGEIDPDDWPAEAWEPVSLGPFVYMDAEPAGSETMPDGVEVHWFDPETTEELQRTIREGRERALIEVFGHTDDGKPFKACVGLSVHPLVYDLATETSFFPVVVGLFFEEGDPSTWPEKDLAKFWERLLEHVEGLAVEAEGREDAGHEKAPLATVQATRVGPVRTLLDGPTRFDRKAGDMIAGLSVRLPKRFDTIPRFEERAEEEVQRLLDEHGDDAFRRVREGLAPRGPLLLRKRDGSARLSREAEETFLATLENRPFLRTVGGREFLVRRVQAPWGHVETGWTWHGRPELVTRDGQDKAEAEAVRFLEDLDQNLFAKPRDKEAARNRLRALRAVKDGPRLMEAIVRRLGQELRNPVEFPAWELRAWLGCEADDDGHARVTDCLRALRRFDYFLTLDPSDGSSKDHSEGAFLLEWRYVGRGAGQHTDGVFYLTVSPTFVGTLAVFETPSHKLKKGQAAVFLDFNRKLDETERKKLDYVRSPSALRPLYGRAWGFTRSQDLLAAFLEREQTRQNDATAFKELYVLRSTEPRVYGHEFCPLLPKGRKFHGALGHHRHNPESGRKLKGTKGRPTKRSGARTEGLLAVMGYDLPPGRAAAKRREIYRAAVEDLRLVVEHACGGVVAGKLKDRWLTVDEALGLPNKDLAENVRWFLFPAADWLDRLARGFEEHQAERFERGEVPHLVKVTKDREEYERSKAELAGERWSAGDEPGEFPLRVRLAMVRRERGLSQATVAKAFGVSQYLVSKWETGTEPDEDGKVRGQAIPEAMVPLVSRWVETGQEPAEEELAEARTRRRGGRG